MNFYDSVSYSEFIISVANERGRFRKQYNEKVTNRVRTVSFQMTTCAVLSFVERAGVDAASYERVSERAAGVAGQLIRIRARSTGYPLWLVNVSFKTVLWHTYSFTCTRIGYSRPPRYRLGLFAKIRSSNSSLRYSVFRFSVCPRRFL